MSSINSLFLSFIKCESRQRGLLLDKVYYGADWLCYFKTKRWNSTVPGPELPSCFQGNIVAWLQRSLENNKGAIESYRPLTRSEWRSIVCHSSSTRTKICLALERHHTEGTWGHWECTWGHHTEQLTEQHTTCSKGLSGRREYGEIKNDEWLHEWMNVSLAQAVRAIFFSAEWFAENKNLQGKVQLIKKERMSSLKLKEKWKQQV